MKRLLFVVNSLECGGAEKSFVTLFRLLNRTKYQADVLVFKKGGSFERFLPKGQVLQMPGGYLGSQNSYRNMLLERRWSDLFLRLSISVKLLVNRRVGNKHHPSEVLWAAVADNVPLLARRYDAAIAFGQGLPTYYVSEKVQAVNKLAWINVDLKKAGYSVKFNKPFYDKFQAIVAVSEELRKLVQSGYAYDSSRVSVIYDLMDPVSIKEISRVGERLPEFDGTRLITIGRLEVPKGYDIAIDAARILMDRGCKFRWFIIGGGSLEKEIRAQIENRGLREHVFLLGLQVNPYGFLAEADVYVQTSRFEGYCLTLAEARIFGKPLVTTNFTVVSNQITDGSNGLIADMTPESVAANIEVLINDRPLQNLFRRNMLEEDLDNVLTEMPKFEALLDNDFPESTGRR